jgi:hypothetical protein
MKASKLVFRRNHQRNENNESNGEAGRNNENAKYQWRNMQYRNHQRIEMKSWREIMKYHNNGVK